MFSLEAIWSNVDGRTGLETYAGYTRCHHCGIYDSNLGWCDLCGMRKEIQRAVNRNGRATAGSVPNRADRLQRLWATERQLRRAAGGSRMTKG